MARKATTPKRASIVAVARRLDEPSNWVAPSSASDATPLFGTFMDTAPTAMAIWNLDGSVATTNPAMRELFGSSPPRGYSIRDDSILRRLGYLHYIERAFAGETVRVPTFWYDPRQLTEVDVHTARRVAISVALFPLRNDLGQITCVGGLFRDDTDMMLAQERLRADTERLEQRVGERTAELAAANRELEAFSYSVSHDLRTPLRAIDGYAARMFEDTASHLSPTGVGYLQRIRDSAQRMSDLINDLLTFARFGRQALTKKEVDTESLVDQVLQDLEPRLLGRDVQVVKGRLPKTQADPNLLREVFLNLLDNALKFTSKRTQARIEIGCQAKRSPCVWYVRDNGVGFDMSHADQLFGVFARLHSEQEFEGTGVGLALVQRIVQRHGGDIWAQAEKDVGAAFYFTLGG